MNPRPRSFSGIFLVASLFAVLLVIVAQDARGEGIPEKCILLQDDFDDNDLDLSQWSVVCGSGQSVSEESMALCIEDGCLLNTVQEFDPTITPLDISVDVDLTNHATNWDRIDIITRSDGIANPKGCGEEGAGCSVQNGIVFSMDGAGSGDQNNDYRIERVVNGVGTSLGVCCAGDPNMSNVFTIRVTDDGNTLRLYKDGVLKLEVDDSTGFASNHVSFRNSNNSPPTVACLDNLVIASCPADGLGAIGDLYVADSGAQNRVLQYHGITGDFVSEFVSDGSGGLKDPNGVTFGPNGNLFVASTSDALDAVLEYDGATGEFIGVFASGCGLDNPTGLAFAPNGNLFVASHLSGSVIEYDGTTGACVATLCEGVASHAMGLAFDTNGDLFVAAQTANQVLKYDGASCQVFVSCGLSSPHDVLFRPNGNLLVANRTGENITEHDGSDGACLGVFASGCGLAQPYGMTLGPDGNLFVASVLTDEVIEYEGTDGSCVGTFANTSVPTFLEFKPPPRVPCPADLDGDGTVGAADLAQLLGAWGSNSGHPADLNGDGTVGAADLAILLASWGECD